MDFVTTHCCREEDIGVLPDCMDCRDYYDGLVGSELRHLMYCTPHGNKCPPIEEMTKEVNIGETVSFYMPEMTSSTLCKA